MGRPFTRSRTCPNTDLNLRLRRCTLVSLEVATAPASGPQKVWSVSSVCRSHHSARSAATCREKRANHS